MAVNTGQPDSCIFVCFYLVRHLETEQQFLVHSLGHLAAQVIRPMGMQSLSFENLENMIWKWIWTEEPSAIWVRKMSSISWAGSPCTLGSLEIITNVPFWKCYTDSPSSMHISILRVLRNPVVKKTLYLNACQIDLTTENYIFLSNNYQ